MIGDWRGCDFLFLADRGNYLFSFPIEAIFKSFSAEVEGKYGEWNTVMPMKWKVKDTVWGITFLFQNSLIDMPVSHG